MMLRRSLLLALLAAACRPEPEPPPALRLDRMPDALVALELPESSRPTAVPDALPLGGPFKLESSDRNVEVYSTPLPVRNVYRGHNSRSVPPGMRLLGPDGGSLRYSNKKRADTWSIEDDRLLLRLRKSRPEPIPGSFQLVHPASTEGENARNLAFSSKKGQDFALRDVRMPDGSRHGVLLPAPARARWRVQVPEEAVFSLEAHLMRPLAEPDALRSDGATLELWLHQGSESEKLGAVELSPGRRNALQVELPASGEAELELRSLPGEDAALDYVFVERPTVYVPEEEPERLLIVFIDTLRADHLGLYGYERETSPHIDALGKESLVFTQARSVAPWTLPSARAAFTGRQPERWSSGPTVAERLSAAGWTTGAFIANAYLSVPLGMNRGFDHFDYRHIGSASYQLGQVQAFLEENNDRDAVVMLHLMDAHLPYQEPRSHRRLWAGNAIKGLGERFSRRDVLTQLRRSKSPEQVKRHVQDRYDQNIRYIDDTLGTLLDALGDETAVLLFSDHGEELWEHGGFEHGHALYDEVMRVPLIIRAPGREPARVDAPVSLLDVTPTLLELAGLPIPPDIEGRSLLDSSAWAELETRPQAFGRTLYGRDQWGSLVGHTKQIRTQDGIETFDLKADPGENAPRGSNLGALSQEMAAAGLGEVVEAWRLELDGDDKSVAFSGSITLRHPGGLEAAWGAYDPNDQLAGPVLEDGIVTLGAERDGRRFPGEIYLLPSAAAESSPGLQIEVRSGDKVIFAGSLGLGSEVRAGARRIRLVPDVALKPSTDATPTFDPELAEELKELGYLE